MVKVWEYHLLKKYLGRAIELVWDLLLFYQHCLSWHIWWLRAHLGFLSVLVMMFPLVKLWQVKGAPQLTFWGQNIKLVVQTRLSRVADWLIASVQFSAALSHVFSQTVPNIEAKCFPSLSSTPVVGLGSVWQCCLPDTRISFWGLPLL